MFLYRALILSDIVGLHARSEAVVFVIQSVACRPSLLHHLAAFIPHPGSRSRSSYGAPPLSLWPLLSE